MAARILGGQPLQEIQTSLLGPGSKLNGVYRGTNTVIISAYSCQLAGRKLRFRGIGQEKDDVGSHRKRQVQRVHVLRAARGDDAPHEILGQSFCLGIAE